jgi:hypothetical protein
MGNLVANLLSGLFGALIATVLSLVYLYISEKAKLRGEVLLEVVGYCDEIYYILQMLQAEKELEYTEHESTLTGGEYRTANQKLSVLLKSSSVHAKMAIAFGEGRELESFNTLRTLFAEGASVLRTATRSGWIIESRKLFDHSAFLQIS